MAHIQSRIERSWNAFGVLVSLGGVADLAYWHRNVWEALLVPLLSIFAGFTFARLIGWFPPAGRSGDDSQS